MKLDFKVRGGIIRTISKAIYSRTVDKIREIVANAVDAKAECVVMSFDKDKKELSIFDNGVGLDRDEVIKIFESLGYGLKRDIPTALSHFGLGLISILQLAKTNALIYSKAKEKVPILLKINTNEMFNEENDTKELSEFSNYLELYGDEEEQVSEELIKTKSRISEILKKHKELEMEYKFDSFTEIVLIGISDDDLEYIGSEEFEVELRKTLPLPVNKNDRFFKKFKDSKFKKDMLEFFDDGEYCPIINFYLNDESISGEAAENSEGIESSQDEDTVKYVIGPHKKLFKYFPGFGRLSVITSENLVMQKKDDYKFYLLARVDDLFTKEEGEQGKKTTGFTLRNKNFLVKENDFFEYSCVTSIHKPLRSWLYAEIFHKDLNDVLQVSRKDIIETEEKFKDFAQGFMELVKKINQNLRSAYKSRAEIRKNFIYPINKVVEGNIFQKIENGLQKSLGEDDIKRERVYNEVLEKLKAKPKEKWFDKSDYLLENVLKEKDIRWYYENIEIVISKLAHVEIGDELISSISGDEAHCTLKISLELFKTREVEFLGKKFALKFVYLGEGASKKNVISFNVTDKKQEIYINIFNDKVKNYTIDVIEVIILINLAYERASNLDDMKEFMINYLEDNYQSNINYTIVERLNKYLLKTIDIK